MNRKKLLYTSIIPVFAVIGLFLQADISHGDKSKSQKDTTLRVVYIPFLSYAPLFIAEEEGFFSEQGIKIEFVEMKSSSAAVPALIQGKLDVVPAQMRTSFLNAMVRGANIKFVACKGFVDSTYCAYTAFVARRSLVEKGGLSDLSQLKGRRISADRMSSSSYQTEKLLEMASLTAKDVEIVEISFAAEFAALQNGAIDICFTGEPFLTKMLRSDDTVLWMPLQRVVPDFQYGVICFGPSLLEKNPDSGKRFMIAYLKAVHQLNQGKTKRNLDILVKHTKLDRELLEACCWPALHSSGQINIESVLEFQEWAFQKKLIDKNIPTDLFWDSRFIDHANQILNSQPR